MYLFDPERGQRRRTLMRDQVDTLRQRARDATDARRRDFRERTSGILSELRTALRREDVPASRGTLSRVGERLSLGRSSTLGTLASVAGTAFLLSLVRRRALIH